MVIGDEKGRVGVGTATAKEVVDAVQKAVADGKKHLITVSLPPRSPASILTAPSLLTAPSRALEPLVQAAPSAFMGSTQTCL